MRAAAAAGAERSGVESQGRGPAPSRCPSAAAEYSTERGSERSDTEAWPARPASTDAGTGGERERERRRRVGAKNRKVAHAPCLLGSSAVARGNQTKARHREQQRKRRERAVGVHGMNELQIGLRRDGSSQDIFLLKRAANATKTLFQTRSCWYTARRFSSRHRVPPAADYWRPSTHPTAGSSDTHLPCLHPAQTELISCTGLRNTHRYAHAATPARLKHTGLRSPSIHAFCRQRSDRCPTRLCCSVAPQQKQKYTTRAERKTKKSSEKLNSSRNGNSTAHSLVCAPAAAALRRGKQVPQIELAPHVYGEL